MDPLTFSYPFYTPYQYAGCEPIANVDVDGLEPFNTLQTLSEVIVVATKTAAKVAPSFANLVNIGSRLALLGAVTTGNIINNSINTSQVGDRALIVARGSSDAILNANTLGLTDLFGSTSNLNDYNDPLDQEAYLQGRLIGDAFAIAQSATQVSSGGSAAAGGLATGPGAVVVSTGALVVAGHGLAVGVVATSDAAWATAKLIRLNMSSKTASNSSSTPTSGETNATKTGRDAHSGYNPGNNYTVDRKTNRLNNGQIPDAIDIKNRIIRELKPSNYRAIKGGHQQLKDYIKQLEKQYKGTKGKWKRVVDTYEELPNGKIKYKFNTPK